MKAERMGDSDDRIVGLRRMPGWNMLLASIFLSAGLLFHIHLITHINDQHMRGFYFDTINTPEPGPGVDFNALYTAAKNLVAGKRIYPTEERLLGKESGPPDDLSEIETPAADPGKAMDYLPPFRYLPAAALAGAPFIHLPFGEAYTAWLVFHELLIFLALYLLFRNTRDTGLGMILCGMVLFFAPYYVEIFQGQFSWPQALLMLLCIHQLEKGGERSSMWWFIASILWKMNTILWVIPLTMAGKWRWLLFLVGAVTVASLPYFIMHPEDIRIFIGINFRPDLTHSFGFGNSGLRMLIDFIMRSIEQRSGGALPDFLVKNLSAIIALIIFAITVLVTWRRRDDLVGCFLIYGTLYFLIYVDIWMHHWLMLLPILLWEYRRTRSPFVFVIWLIIALPARFDWIGNYDDLKNISPGSVHNFKMALLYFGQKSIPALAFWGWQARRMMRNGGNTG